MLEGGAAPHAYMVLGSLYTGDGACIAASNSAPLLLPVSPPTPTPAPSIQVLERAVAAAKMANGGKQPQLVLVLLPFKVRGQVLFDPN